MDVDTGGRFVNPWHEPRVPVIRGDENNELDMTFSFGRDIDGPGVDAFLLANAFRDFDEMRKVVDTMHVNPKSHKIRQVVHGTHPPGNKQHTCQKFLTRPPLGCMKLAFPLIKAVLGYNKFLALFNLLTTWKSLIMDPSDHTFTYLCTLKFFNHIIHI